MVGFIIKSPRGTGKKVLCAVTMLAMLLTVLAPLTVYAATNPRKITVNQVATNDGTFTYRLKPLEAGNPMPAGSTAEGYTFSITGTGSAEIELPSYPQQGVYRYSLAQIIGTERPGYTCDKRVYTIEAHVDVMLEMDIVVRNQDGEKEGDIVFENSHKALPSDPALMVDPPVKKIISGTPNYNTTFEFRLVARDASSPMPAGSVNGTKIIKIAGAGEGEFGTWSYDKAGTYYYTVYEVDGGASGYTYDTTVYTITDTVKDENGQLVLSRVVTNDLNKPSPAYAFLNKFNEGKDGPQTDDGMNTTLFAIMFAAGALLAIGTAIYLITGGKRKGGEKRYGEA